MRLLGVILLAVLAISPLVFAQRSTPRNDGSAKLDLAHRRASTTDPAPIRATTPASIR
jgi:hypothetical protein